MIELHVDEPGVIPLTVGSDDSVSLGMSEHFVEYDIPVDDELSYESRNPVENMVITAALDGKVDKEAGKGLSENSFTTAEKTKLSGIEAGAQINPPIDAALSASSTNAVQNRAVNSALGGKVDKETGKGLSSNDYTDADKGKLAGVEAGAQKNETVDTALSATSTHPVQNRAIKAALDGKVDSVSGKGLSSNDFTTAEKEKLAGIETGAQVNETVDTALSATSVHPVQNKVVKSALDGKVNTVSGKGLSSNDYTTTDKNKLAGIETGAQVNETVDTALSLTSSHPVENKAIKTALDGKVDTISGKGLSTNDYTTADKNKLDGIEAGAQVNPTIDTAMSSSSGNPVANSAITDAIADARGKVFYGELDAGSTATVMTAQIPGITAYEEGLVVILKNGVVTSAANFTININGLGALPVYSNMAADSRETTVFNVNYTMMFVYEERVSGGDWLCYRGYDSNTNTIGYQLRSNSMDLPMKSITYRYRLLFTSADGAHFVPANNSTSTNATASRAVCQDAIDPFGDIRYYSSTASVAAGSRPSAAALWQQYTLSLGYSFNRTGAALTLTPWAPVYVKCTPQADGSAVIDATTPYVQALPTTDDGKIYIFIGVAYSATSIELLPYHPVYWHDGTGIRLWTGKRPLSYALSMSGNVITLTGSDNSTTTVTLPVYNGGVS